MQQLVLFFHAYNTIINNLNTIYKNNMLIGNCGNNNNKTIIYKTFITLFRKALV